MLGEPIFRSGTAAIAVPERNWRTKAMRNVCKSVFLVCLVTWAASVSAQTASFPVFNFPPCDFSDNFYTENGFDASKLSTMGARFGDARLTGAPAFLPGQVNWVTDGNCSVNDPNRRNVRILATTGAYKDDTGLPTEFFSVIAFVFNQNFFNNIVNARGFMVQDIVGAFEAYAATKQTVNGVLAPSPCGSMGDGLQPCFSPIIATPGLRHDWRLSSNRMGLDGSGIPGPIKNVPNPVFSYFGDDLTGSWIITHFWWTKFAVGGRPDQPTPTSTCKTILAAAGKQNGFSLDGTPILHSGDELHFIEGVPGTPPQFGFSQNQTNALLQAQATAPCGAEGNLAPNGTDGGAVWLVCPAILDPRNGAVATDAFLDVVRNNGSPIDGRFQTTFSCLQSAGKFCNE